jgi:four helix bundle protein
MLRIVAVLRGLVPVVAPMAVRIQRKDPDLARQFRRAMNSALLNTAEGGGVYGARRRHHYAIALGSAREALEALRAAEGWGYLEPLPFEVTETFAKIVGTLVKNTR